MPGFPIAWTEKDSEGKTVSNVCPYTPEEIREYLHSCHYHFALDEEPMEFGVPHVVSERRGAGRLMWLWECEDPLGRWWWIVIGSGPNSWRWMYADAKEAAETDEAYLDRAWCNEEKNG
jgi:hypothetical protein